MKKVHLIGNAHLDPVWLWRWQEGFAEIKATFRSALDRMREFDDFIFTSACGAYYMWIEKSDPEMFREIQQRVKEGRWCIVGGWIIQPDCNIPSGESFARHAYITQNYFIEKFGKPATVGYNVDSFGHNGALPKILSASGMKAYVFMRPMQHEKELPTNLFLWESDDGSRIPTYRLPLSYNISLRFDDPFGLFKRIGDIDDSCEQMAFYGVGNHGGGPTTALLREMHEKLGEEFVYSSPDRYFEAQDLKSLPVIKDDMQFHAKGCYSAYSEIKRNNRYSENALLEAEKLSVLSNHLLGTEYPGAELDHAWKRVLFNQFHDILGGCSIREAYDDAREAHGEALSIAHRIQNFACQQISWNIDTLAGHPGGCVSSEEAEELGIPIVIFNSLDHEIVAPVHLRNTYNGVRDSEGNIIPVQVVRDSKTNGRFDHYARLFEAKVPAFGYRVYRMFEKTLAPVECNPFITTENSIENEKLRLVFNKDGGELCSIYDKIQKRELLAGDGAIRLYDDTKNDTWAHDTVFFKDMVECDVSGSLKLIENGPVRVTVRTEQKFNGSIMIRDYSLTRTSDYVDVKVKLDFHEKHRILKLEYPVAADNCKAVCKIPYGYIERKCDGSEQVCGDWVALFGDGDRGISIATDSKHSFEAEGNKLSVTALRSTMFADHFGVRDEFCEYMEQGEHTFKYRISPFASYKESERCASELQFPPFALQETFHKGRLPEEFSGLSISEDNLTVTAIKEHKSGDGVVLRLYECDGQDTEAKVSLLGTSFVVKMPHNSVKTFIIKDGSVKETDFIE